MGGTCCYTVILILNGKHGNTILKAFLIEELRIKSKIETVTFVIGRIRLYNKGHYIIRLTLHKNQTRFKRPYVSRISLYDTGIHCTHTCSHLCGIGPHSFGKRFIDLLQIFSMAHVIDH